jgi:hypothetical protein
LFSVVVVRELDGDSAPSRECIEGFVGTLSRRVLTWKWSPMKPVGTKPGAASEAQDLSK